MTYLFKEETRLPLTLSLLIPLVEIRGTLGRLDISRTTSVGFARAGAATALNR
jgi:hypothetical protein